MARIEIQNLTADAELSREEQNDVVGGLSEAIPIESTSLNQSLVSRKAGKGQQEYLVVTMTDLLISG